MKRVLSIIIFVCLLMGMLPTGSISVFAAENSTVPCSTDQFKAIVAGGLHTVALKEDGTVIAWGCNKYGQCTIPNGLTHVKAICAGWAHTVALKEDGTIVAWGLNTSGQCTTPVGLSGVKDIAAGDFYTVALKEDGTVIAWGDNTYGQCKVPSSLTGVKAIATAANYIIALKEDSSLVVWGSATDIPSGLTGIKSISAGENNLIALKEDGTVAVWGDNTFDQCKVPADLTHVKAISSGTSYIVALKEDGTVVAWGLINSADSSVLPQLYDIKAIDVGWVHTLAIKKDGTVIAFGNNSYGQCIVPSNPSSFKTIATGKDNAFALKEDGTVISWGSNIYATGFYSTRDIVVGDTHGMALEKDGSIFNWGYICNGNQTLESKRLSGMKAIAVGTNHEVALKEDGTIVAWGDNTYGQCSIPVGVSPVKAIAAGGRHTLATKEDGTIIAWGDNTYGQCSIPANLSGVKTIASGDLYSVALKEDGTVIAWGSNKYGQCNVPAHLTSVKAIAAGTNHIVALKEDGTVIAWGDNSEGQCSIPVEILPVKAIYAGNSNTILLGKDGKVTGLGWDFIIPFAKYIPTNFIAPSAAEFDPSGTGDITIGIGKDNSKLLAVKNGTASLNNNDYSISGNTVTIKKSYLSYFFNKFNLPGQKLSLTFDFEDGNDTVFMVTRTAVSNSISCSNPNFDSSNRQDIIVNITGSAIKAIKNGTASLNSNDYSISGNTVIIKKSYLSYFFTKFNMPWAKLNLTFDFESGNDPLFTVSPVSISNFATCETPVFDLSNPQDIKVNISGNTLTAIKNGTASLSSNDYSISGNTVTIKKSYLSYFFNRFTAPGQKLTLTFDFEKGNDPLFTVTRTQSSNNLTSFIGMVKTVKIEGQTVTLTKGVNGISTEMEYPVNTLSDDLKTDAKTATTSAIAVNMPITWVNFAINDMQGIAGDKTSVTDPQHRIYRFYINTNNKITKIERLDFSTDIIPTKFNKTSNCIGRVSRHVAVPYFSQNRTSPIKASGSSYQHSHKHWNSNTNTYLGLS